MIVIGTLVCVAKVNTLYNSFMESLIGRCGTVVDVDYEDGLALASFQDVNGFLRWWVHIDNLTTV